MAATIVIADASLSDRTAFREVLKGTAYEVVADAGNGDALLEAALKHKPWCVAFDLQLPGHADRGGDGGTHAMKRVKQKLPATKFLVIHNVQTAQLVMGALNEGAGARVRKPFKLESLLEAFGKLGTGQEGTTSIKQATVRLKKSLTLSYKLATDGFFTKKRDAVTTDVSEGGIGATVGEKLGKTNILNVEIDLGPDGPLKARMQVARVEPIAGLPRYEVGLVFLDLDPASRDRLKAFVRREVERVTAAPARK